MKKWIRTFRQGDTPGVGLRLRLTPGVKELPWWRNHKEGIILAIVLTLWLRLVLLVVGYNLAIRFNKLPLTTREMDFSENIPQDRKDPWFYIVQPLHRFDALWYEEIAKNNYKNQPLTTAFFPLYPWTVNFFAQILHLSYPVSAFFLNTIFTFLVFYLLYYWVQMEHGRKIALRTILIYAFSPVSFFLLVPYAEPLLFLFILFSFIFAKYNRVMLSIISGCFAALVKPYGAVVVVPLSLILLSKNMSLKKRIGIFLLLVLIPMTFFVVNKYQEYMTSSISSTLNAQFLWGAKIPLPWEPFLSEIQIFLRNPFDLPNSLNLIMVVLSVIFLINTWKKISWRYWLYTLFLFSVSYLLVMRHGVLFSFSRHALAFFPMFAFLGNFKVGKTAEVIYLATSVFITIMLFVWYTFGFFVA
jgi:hypothetical protein